MCDEIDGKDEASDNEPRYRLLSLRKVFARMFTNNMKIDDIVDRCDVSTPLIPTDEEHLSDHFILVAEMIEDQISVEHEHFTYFWYINILMLTAFQIIDS